MKVIARKSTDISSEKTSEKEQTKEEDYDKEDKRLVEAPVNNKADERSVGKSTDVNAHVFNVNEYCQAELSGRPDRTESPNIPLRDISLSQVKYFCRTFRKYGFHDCISTRI